MAAPAPAQDPVGDTSQQYDSSNEEESAPAVVLGVVCGFLIGLLIRTVFAATPHRYRKYLLPFTASVLIAGLAVGFVVVYGSSSDTMSDGLRQLESIDPTVLFAVFMPALITPSGLELNFHEVQHVWLKIFMLAIPGTMINASLITMVVKYVFPYSWSWSQSWLLGAILSATDPIAVISIMESSGCNPLLTTTINGESLLNDGVAYVMFEVFLGWAQGEPVIASDVVKFVFKAALGGPALGIAFALAVLIWLQILDNDSIAIITVTLTASYSIWVLSDQILSVSAVLAVLFFSMFIGLYGRNHIGSRSQKSFRFFWSWVDWIANTLIFFLAGLIIATELSNQNRANNITGKDWGMMFSLYFLLIPIRAVSIVLLSPILRYGRYGLSLKDLLILSWSGLRGAVGLTLSLIVYNSEDLDDKFRVLCFFNVGMIAVLTLLLQGTTVGIFLEKLGYTSIPAVKKHVQVQSAEVIDHLSRSGIHEAQQKALHGENLLGVADWDRVASLSNIDVVRFVKDRMEKDKKHQNEKKDDFTIHETELLFDLRERLLRTVHANYKICFSQEYLTPAEMSALSNSVENGSDKIDMPLSDWDCLRSELDLSFLKDTDGNSWQDRLRRLSGSINKVLFMKRGPLQSLAKRNTALVSAFICAHAEAQRELDLFVELEAAEGEAEASNRTIEVSKKDTRSDQAKLYEPFWDADEFRGVAELARLEQSQQEDGSTTALPTKASLRCSLVHELTRNSIIVVDDVRKILRIVLEENMLQIQKAEELFRQLKSASPDEVLDVATEFVSIDILRKQSKMLDFFLDLGFLEEDEVSACQEIVLNRIRSLRGHHVGT
jgi:NhaP-type Na+/H+ or K+/H+ antiporter